MKKFASEPNGEDGAFLRIEVQYLPVASLLDGSVYGYEAVPCRKDGRERLTAEKLFAEAEALGCLPKCYRLFQERAVAGWSEQKMEKKLFLPVPASLIGDELRKESTPKPSSAPESAAVPAVAGSLPEQIVLKLIGSEGKEESAVLAALRHYRKQGYRIALSDISVDRASLIRLLSLHPDYAFLASSRTDSEPRRSDKLDGERGDSAAGTEPIRSPRRTIPGSLTKSIERTVDETLLQALTGLARKEQVVLIAQGIDRQSQLALLSACGIGYGQGDWIGREERQAPSLRPSVREIIRREAERRFRTASGSLSELAMPAEVFDSQTPVSEIATYFERHRDTHGFVIADEGRPVGLLMKEKLQQLLSGKFGLALYWNRSVGKIMDKQPLVLEEATPLEQVAQLAMAREQDKLYDAIIVTRQGRVYGIASARAVLEWVTQAHMANAQYANPLTGLPGNVPIRQEMTRRLGGDSPFSVLYADIDHFKWFNDRFGFQLGDEVIRFTGEMLLEAVRSCCPDESFVGHIGGDDFIAILPCGDPVEVSNLFMELFERGIGAYCEEAGPVTDRNGNATEASGLSLSLALLLCDRAGGWTPEQLAEHAAKLKKRAKRQTGNSLAWESISSDSGSEAKPSIMVGVDSE